MKFHIYKARIRLRMEWQCSHVEVMKWLSQASHWLHEHWGILNRIPQGGYTVYKQSLFAQGTKV
jgi:hypothetical protein